NLIHDLNPPVHEVEPRSSSRQELVNQMTAGIENRRINPGVLAQPQRRLSAVAGEQQPQHIAALREGEALLLPGRLNNRAVRSHEAPEHPGRIDPRAVPPAVERAVLRGGPLTFPRLQGDLPAAGILEDEGAVPDVGQDFKLAGGPEFELPAGRQPFLPKTFEGSKSVVAGIEGILRVERTPGLLPSGDGPDAFLRPSKSDHRRLRRTALLINEEVFSKGRA